MELHWIGSTGPRKSLTMLLAHQPTVAVSCWPRNTTATGCTSGPIWIARKHSLTSARWLAAPVPIATRHSKASATDISTATAAGMMPAETARSRVESWPAFTVQRNRSSSWLWLLREYTLCWTVKIIAFSYLERVYNVALWLPQCCRSQVILIKSWYLAGWRGQLKKKPKQTNPRSTKNLATCLFCL